MITAGFIILIIVWAAFLFMIFFGKPGDDSEDPTIIWKKLDEHEKKIAE